MLNEEELRAESDEWRRRKLLMEDFLRGEGWKWYRDQVAFQIRMKQQALLDLEPTGQDYAHALVLRKGELMGMELMLKMPAMVIDEADQQTSILKEQISLYTQEREAQTKG